MIHLFGIFGAEGDTYTYIWYIGRTSLLRALPEKGLNKKYTCAKLRQRAEFKIS